MKKPEKKGTNDLHCFCEKGLEEYHDCEFSFVHGYNLAIEEYKEWLSEKEKKRGVKMENKLNMQISYPPPEPPKVTKDETKNISRMPDKDEIVEVLTEVSDKERHNLVTRGLFIKQAEAIVARLEKKQEQAWE